MAGWPEKFLKAAVSFLWSARAVTKNTRIRGRESRTFFYNADVPLLKNLSATLEMIKWEHSVFALPFALCGAMLAAHGIPTAHQLIWIVIAMVAARSAAMSFNRVADAAID